MLFKNGKGLDAAPIIERALRLGTQHATMKHHAAQIFHAAAESKKAEEMLRAALVMFAREMDVLLQQLPLLAQQQGVRYAPVFRRDLSPFSPGSSHEGLRRR